MHLHALSKFKPLPLALMLGLVFSPAVFAGPAEKDKIKELEKNWSAVWRSLNN